MTRFVDFLQQRLDASGFSTEDVLASYLPLVRQVLNTHRQGKVAPLAGLAPLQVEGVQIWYPEDQQLPINSNASALLKVERPDQSAVEVVGQWERTTDVGEGRQQWVDLQIGQRGMPLERPVYLPGYLSWEEELEHHDPLVDVFNLGLILASLSCHLDFRNLDDLRRFVAHRDNLFRFNPDLHPVLAQAIVRMTELNRHRRAQDLAALLHSLENYREQEVDIEFDLARMPGFHSQDLHGKQQIVLHRLQQRLFELSRRNRLLHFKPTMQSINLTQASVPLSFDVEHIRSDQLLTWTNAFADSVVGGQPLSLNKFLNLQEVLYVPGLLDHIRAEARRDAAEFGFAQLRIVACFLRWSNVKATPPESFDSPLVLLPVELTKKKGIRDAYMLRALSAEAEVNPVLRYQFKELFDIELPETIDLSSTRIDALYDFLAARIQASDPGVRLNKVERPRIDLIHDRARRRLDQYRRRARIAGRGVKSFLDHDYSYDPANYHPLGITLFSSRIRTPSSHLREVIEQHPRERNYFAESDSPRTSERQRMRYALREGEENPYHWQFDLCNVTLANFKYRKMSLVRDYASLVQETPENEAFEATFSLRPRDIAPEVEQLPALGQRYHVVACDPTQAAAIATAHSGKSYIIQGPPGTGKSQTITNLIADYVARGKRVLFVCEKRAAIDVVYLRLRQQGLGELCCLIHDSQADKKAFVMNLKETYEGFLAGTEKETNVAQQREEIVDRLHERLRPLEHFHEAMQSTLDKAGIPLRSLIERSLELRQQRPELSPLQVESLPPLAEWQRYREPLKQLQIGLEEFGSGSVFAHHPLRLLKPALAAEDRPLAKISQALPRLQQLLQQVSRLGEQDSATLDELRQQIDYAREVEMLAEGDLLELLDKGSAASRRLSTHRRKVTRGENELSRCEAQTTAWRSKLNPVETRLALGQAEAAERNFLSFLFPSWWRLRNLLQRSYDFSRHRVRPRWVQILGDLNEEHLAAEKLEQLRADACDDLGYGGSYDQLQQQVESLREKRPKRPSTVQALHQTISSGTDQGRAIAARLQIDPPLQELEQLLDTIFVDFQDESLEQLAGHCDALEQALDQFPDFAVCLAELHRMSPELARALRHLPFTADQIEAAAAHACLEDVYREDRDLRRFDAEKRARQVRRLSTAYDTWQASNAELVKDRVRQRFREHIRVCTLPASSLDGDQKAFKKSYNRGRRELEHEFGKSMRYKSIRDLVSGESGSVVQDLKPVWLMSPLSVSDTLPLDSDHFDVVIFDEASQITLEEAVPSLFRARQAIVVGDEMQLPPTDFFSSRRSDEEEALLIHEAVEVVHYDLGSNSFLNHSSKNLASRMLGWHYRSRSESLISFSNWAFYHGRLLTVPEEELVARERPEIRVTRLEQASDHAKDVLQRAISFHFMENGLYERRRNRAEADYIARLVRELLLSKAGVSIGIVAFSEAQQSEIEAALSRLAQGDAKFADRLEAEYEREEDGQFVGLLVKNLENIQGDERDVIILSVCYGYGPDGRMLMNFGPINKSGGEKRLNVAFSRAKHQMAIVSSIRHTDIKNDYNEGANCLKQYLRYAAAISTGNRDSAQQVLGEMTIYAEAEVEERPDALSLVPRQIAEALQQRGYRVDFNIGQSHFRCDLGVYREGDSQYRLGILVDTENWYAQEDLLERDLMRPKLLENFGWSVQQVLAKDWYDDPDKVLEQLETQLAED